MLFVDQRPLLTGHRRSLHYFIDGVEVSGARTIVEAVQILSIAPSRRGSRNIVGDGQGPRLVPPATVGGNGTHRGVLIDNGSAKPGMPPRRHSSAFPRTQQDGWRDTAWHSHSSRPVSGWSVGRTVCLPVSPLLCRLAAHFALVMNVCGSAERPCAEHIRPSPHTLSSAF